MEKAFLSSDCSKVKDGWESGNSFKFDKDYPYGYPWPPRYYTCSFCQREFKSAQALGGHMNIHRRDRARLRAQSPNNNPIILPNTSDQNPSPNPIPNPNPNYYNPINNCSPSSSPANNNIYAHQYSLVSLSLSSFPPPTKNGEKLRVSRDFQGMGKQKDLFSSLENHHLHHHDHRNEHEARVFKSSSTKEEEEVKLDLELCLGEAKEDLDLELRLGI